MQRTAFGSASLRRSTSMRWSIGSSISASSSYAADRSCLRSSASSAGREADGGPVSMPSIPASSAFLMAPLNNRTSQTWELRSTRI